MFLQLGHFSHSIGAHIRGNLNFVEAPTNPSCQDTGERHKTKGWDGLGAQRGAFPGGSYLPGIMRDRGVPSMGELWIFLDPCDAARSLQTELPHGKGCSDPLCRDFLAQGSFPWMGKE